MSKEQTIPVRIVGTPAAVLARAIAAGDISSVEAVDAHIARIEARENDLNAMAIPLFEQARSAARQADEERAGGADLGALHGVPITIKEQFKLAGTDTTMGLRRRRNQPYDQHGPLIARLKGAGAVILGKTNIMQLLLGA